MHMTRALFTLALTGSLLAGCASPSAPSTARNTYLSTEQSVVSDRADMNFKDGDTYFKAQDVQLSNAQFSASLNACVQFNFDSYQKNGQGVQVMRSLGYSEAKIINDGSRLCMESKGWALYKVLKDQLQRIDNGERSYAALSQAELDRARDLVSSQRAWYLKYAPHVLAVGDLKH